MALEAAAALPPGSDALLVPLLDARKGEVYAGFYRAAGGRAWRRSGPRRRSRRSAVASRLEGLGRPFGFGEGFAAHAGVLAGRCSPGSTAAPDTPSGDAVGAARRSAPRGGAPSTTVPSSRSSPTTSARARPR